MIWFKHYLGNADGDSELISELLCEYDTDGYYVFFRTLELMCLEFNIYNPGKNEFFFKYFCSKFIGISPKKIRKILEICEKYAQKHRGEKGIYFKIEGKKVLLNCPKLKKSCDEYTQKKLGSVGTLSGQEGDKSQKEIGAIELELEELTPVGTEVPQKVNDKDGGNRQGDSDDFYLENIEELKKALYKVYWKKIDSKGRNNVYAWVSKQKHENVKPRAVFFCLKYLYDLGMKDRPEDPWAWCEGMLKKYTDADVKKVDNPFKDIANDLKKLNAKAK